MKRNAVELVALAVSVLAIAILVGILVVEGLDESRPADPSVALHADQARAGAAGWIVPATLRNEGDQAAEQVVLEATASVAGAEETSELTVGFLPAGTAVEIAFGFSAQPTGAIEVRLVGFVRP